jgi:GH15 family glucan-1,4-alpha-glucosidase
MAETAAEAAESRPIEDYALVGNLSTAALIARDGAVDWFCPPRFDSPACFAALLGDGDNGRWRLGPANGHRTRRRYLPDTLVLETVHETDDGVVEVIDFMPYSGTDGVTQLVRLVRGRSGRVEMATEIVLRFDYGSVVPWVRHGDDGGMHAIAGPNAVVIRTPVRLRGADFRTRGSFTVAAGETVPFVLTCFPSHLPDPAPDDPEARLRETQDWWRAWAARCTYEGPWRDQVVRSLITLKALTHAATGAIVAAPTTSLPEEIGGARNWDYRYCWLRDATFTLYALETSGYREEAVAWRRWLLRAVAGSPEQMQPLYGIAGERRLPELELAWLKGYAGSRPVRIGNLARTQVQHDVLGEMMDALHVAREQNLDPLDDAWRLQVKLVEFMERDWREPDRGIWEMRGPPRHFTHSKVMAWVALDRAAKAVTRFGLEGPADRWRALADRIHAEVCREGYDAEANTFVQHYGGKGLDGSLLMLPLVGFLPPDDPRIRGTVEAVQRRLCVDGLVRRYLPDERLDGMPGGEGTFLACSFWLVDNLTLMGREDEATALFERLAGFANDLGLIAEEYDPKAGRMLGNFPQAFSHIALVNSAHNLAGARGPAPERAAGGRSKG